MLIVGTGAVATLLAQGLAGSHDLQLFGSESPRIGAFRERFGVLATSRIEEVREHRLWLVVVKAGQNREKARALSRAPRPEAILVLQNGLQPEVDWLNLGVPVVERGLCTYGVRSVAPGLVVGGEQGEITLVRGSQFASVLASGGFAVARTTNLRRAVWQKLAVNASLNVVASILGLPNGAVLEHPRGRALAGGAAAEVAAVARAAGIDWGDASPWALVRRVALATSTNVCSTLADLRLGRSTEYDAINGEVLRAAFRLGVEVPVLARLDREFRALASPRLDFEAQPA